MFKLPKWLSDIFSNSTCPFVNCKKKLSSDGVIAIGIREEQESESNKHGLSFFYEYKCPHCNNRSFFTGFPTSYEDFIGDMIEISNLEAPEGDIPFLPPRKSKISPSEVKEARRGMRKAKDFKDFMKSFGIDDVEPDEKNESKNK